MKNKGFFAAVFAFSVGTALLFKNDELAEGIRKGLHACSYAVIPAVFPFMVLSVFICKSEAADFMEKTFSPLTKFLRIPSACGGVILASVIGGYPSAAKCLNDFVLEGITDRKTAARMLCFCVNAGPAFLISALGTGVFRSIKTGVMLFASQIISAFIIALATSVFSEKTYFPDYYPVLSRKSNAICVTEAVVSAAESVFRMCAFIVITFGITELLYDGFLFQRINSPLMKAAFSGFFEVTAGCLACGEIKGFSGAILAGAIASFSGVSVILQVAAVTAESKIDLVPFIVSRFFHAGITAGILRFFLIFSSETAEVFSVKGGSYEAVLSASAPAAVSLLCMASLFLLSLVPPKSEKESFFIRLKYHFSKK